MGLIKNAINFGNGFNIGAVAPIDSRMRVELLSDLTSVWTAEIPAYKGMIVTVMETSDVYVLKDVDNYTNIASWVKLGSADAANNGAADALTQAKAYTDQEVKKLADGAVKTNTDAIATLNGDAETDGSVAKAVATEKARAEAKEGELNNAITAETAARKAAINGLDAEVTSTDGSHVTVKVTEVDGVITAVNVTESDIASASATTNAIATEKTRAEAAESGLTDAIEAEKTRALAVESGLTDAIEAEKTRALAVESGLTDAINAEAERAIRTEADLAGRIQAIEEAPYATEQDVTNESDRAKAAESGLTDAINAEAERALAAESGLSGRLDVIEGEGDGSVEKAFADAKAYTDDEIKKLDAAVGSQTIAEGKHVAVEVVEVDGVLTSLTVVEDDIASAAVLAEVKEDVDKFFKDAEFAESAKDTLKELQDYITSDVAGAATMTQAIADNKKAIEDEAARAEAAEAQALTDAKAYTDEKVAAEKTRAEGKEGELATAIATEKTRAEAAESGLTDAIEAEKTRALAVESGLTDAIEAEAERALAAESGLTDAINAEAERALAAESGLTDAINAEAKTREDADKAINNTIGKVDEGKTVVDMIKAAEAAAIAAATIVAKDSEFITIEQTGEAGKTQTYTIKTQDVASASATTAAIDAEKTRAEGKEGELATAIATEKTRAEAAESGLTDAIEAEKTRALAVESGLESRLATVEGDYVKSVEAVKGSMITVSESEQKVTLSLQWGTF